jgi:transcriptional regulator with XRE-family HTH domain
LQLGNRLRQAREEASLSQIQVKERTRINNKTLSNYENNVSSPDPFTLQLLADLYGVTTDWIISGKHPQPQMLDTPGLATQPFYITKEDLELLRKLKNLPPEKRKAIEILASADEQSASIGK